MCKYWAYRCIAESPSVSLRPRRAQHTGVCVDRLHEPGTPGKGNFLHLVVPILQYLILGQLLEYVCVRVDVCANLHTTR